MGKKVLVPGPDRRLITKRSGCLKKVKDKRTMDMEPNTSTWEVREQKGDHRNRINEGDGM